MSTKKSGVIQIYKEKATYREYDKSLVESEFDIKLVRESSVFFTELPKALAKFNAYAETDRAKFNGLFPSWNLPSSESLNEYIIDPTYKGVVDKVLKVCERSVKSESVRKKIIFVEYEGRTTGQFKNDDRVSLDFDYSIGWVYTYADGTLEFWVPNEYSDGKFAKYAQTDKRSTLSVSESAIKLFGKSKRVVDHTPEREQALELIKTQFKSLITRLDDVFNKISADEFAKILDGKQSVKLIEGGK